MKKPIGRPTKYKAEYCTQATKLCRLGATDRELADFFEVDEKSINTWKKEHPQFLQSLKKGKIQADSEVADKLYRRALGYSVETVKIFSYEGTTFEHDYVEHYPPDTTACIFWLKNRRSDQWRDVSHQMLQDKAKKEIESLTDEQLAEKHEEAAKSLREQLQQKTQ